MNELIAYIIPSLFILGGILILWIENRTGKSDNNLRLRFFSSIFLTVIAIASIYIGGIVFACFIFLVASICIKEFMQMIAIWNHKAYRNVALISLIILIISAIVEPFFIPNTNLSIVQAKIDSMGFHPFYAVIVPIIMINLLVPIFLRSYRGMVMRELSTIFAILYFGWFLAHSILLRNLDNGLTLSTYFVLIVAANDICAYTAGRTLGRHKMAPEISNKKTWEGFAGGLIGSLISAVGFKFLIPGFSLINALGAGLLMAIAAPFGDLIVSVMKRDMNKKDSSNLIPGHGGLLDRSDSIIFAVPNFYYYVLLLQTIGN